MRFWAFDSIIFFFSMIMQLHYINVTMSNLGLAILMAHSLRHLLNYTVTFKRDTKTSNKRFRWIEVLLTFGTVKNAPLDRGAVGVECGGDRLHTRLLNDPTWGFFLDPHHFLTLPVIISQSFGGLEVGRTKNVIKFVTTKVQSMDGNFKVFYWYYCYKIKKNRRKIINTK